MPGRMMEGETATPASPRVEGKAVLTMPDGQQVEFPVSGPREAWAVLYALTHDERCALGQQGVWVRRWFCAGRRPCPRQPRQSFGSLGGLDANGTLIQYTQCTGMPRRAAQECVAGSRATAPCPASRRYCQAEKPGTCPSPSLPADHPAPF